MGDEGMEKLSCSFATELEDVEGDGKCLFKLVSSMERALEVCMRRCAVSISRKRALLQLL